MADEKHRSTGARRPRAESNTAPRQPPRVVRRKPGRPRLDERAAVEAASRGATLANVARAAGSRAKRPADLRAIGGRIMKRLRDSGQIEDAFAEAGYTIADWCRGVIEQTQATKTLRVCYRGRVVDEIEVPDWPARATARQQYAEAVGLFRLSPADPEDCAASPLSELSDETLCRLMEWVEQLEKDPAAAPPAAAAGLP